MDALLSRLGYQALNMAMRSGIALTSNYAISQCSRLMKEVDDKNIVADLKKLQRQLDGKIKVLSPAIDLIEFKSGRGNAFLESAVPLARALHADITSLGKDLEEAAVTAEQSHYATTPDEQHRQFRRIIADIKDLLARIDRDIPLLHMAITASGESLASSLSQGVSPSRLLQASTLLNFGDTQFAHDPTQPVQIGPSFTLSLYMLFLGHAGQPSTSQGTGPSTPDPSRKGSQEEESYGTEEGDRKPMWQEVLHKARVRLCRTPPDHIFDGRCGYRPDAARDPEHGFAYGRPQPARFEGLARSGEYSYHIEIIEDLDDGRLHAEDETEHHPYDDVPRAGIRESMPVHQLSKIFYADTGRILNIGSNPQENNPVLLLKRDVSARSAASLWGDTRPPSYHAEALPPINGNEQDDVDRQIREETSCAEGTSRLDILPDESGARKPPPSWSFPAHLDPEWLAFEVFVADDDDDGSSDSSSANEDTGGSSDDDVATHLRSRNAKDRSSVDAKLLEQLKSISLGSSPSPMRECSAQQSVLSARSFVARSPFGAITTSLSLMEMLIRLTSLQEFQQASHLSIDDHILTFFLEETSTTGLDREERWRARAEAKRRVGFDPYTDTPTKS